MFPSAVNNNAPTCAQTSPAPAMHVQCAQITSPDSLTPTHTLRGGADCSIVI